MTDDLSQGGYEPQISRPTDPDDNAPALRGEALLSHIRAGLTDKRQTVRRRAVLLLNEVEGDEVVDLLIGLTRDGDPVIRLKAANLLASRRAERALPAISAMLHPRHAPFLGGLAHYLTHIAPCEALPYLLDGYDRCAAVVHRNQLKALAAEITGVVSRCPDGYARLISELGGRTGPSVIAISARLVNVVSTLPLELLLTALHAAALPAMHYESPAVRSALRRFAEEARNQRPAAAKSAVDLLEALEARYP